ncbi:hypothetical protein EDD22DRAFT_283681 [Suillus occidentalis]|nr:hypothetical protein EDD22DRAFT_283681 [Suillus occidentalis]
MLTSLTHFTVYLALASSVLGATIPAATVTAMSIEATTSGTLWKNNVHDKVYSSEAPAAILTEALRRSGELWRGREHEEVDLISRRSGELWRGLEHEEVTPIGRTPSRRSGELWRGLEHEEISASPDV